MVDEETARRDRLRTSVALLTEQLVEEDGPEEQYQCCICKGFCYLSQVTCSCTALVACVDHADQLCKCDSTKRTLRKRYSEAQLEEILAAVQARASQPQQWRSRLENVLTVARPPLKSLRALLAEGEKIAHDMPEVHYLRAMVDRANAWIEKFTAIATRKSTGRKKRRQTGPEDEQDRNPEVLRSLMEEAEKLSFDAPEILQLRQMALAIETFQDEAQKILSHVDDDLDIEDCERALILGQSLNLDLPEIQEIQKIVNRLRWLRKVGWEVDDRTMEYKDTLALLEEANEYGISPEHPWVRELQERQDKGSAWNRLADEVLSAKRVTVSDLDRVIDSANLAPISQEKLLQVENVRKQILTWQSTAKAQLDGHGTANAAQRLCKAVKSATGPLRNFDIPEVDLLQKELDFHAKWTADVAQSVGIQPKQVTGFLNNLLLSMEQHLNPDDLRPSPNFTCFCRAPRSGVMVTCQACHADYHPKCVRVSPSNVDKPFKCAMCLNSSYDDRPSLNALSYMSVPEGYHFLIVPNEMTTLIRIVDIAVLFAQAVVPHIDPLGTAVPCRDFDLLAHWHRKLFNLPVTFDLENTAANSRVILEEWIWKRMTDAKKPVKAQMRQRKPKLILRQSKPGMFACICTTPPSDTLLTVECHKCQQSYHASCVRAPEECLGPDKVNWRCPCCTVRDARRYQQGNVPVRVQNSGKQRNIEEQSAALTHRPTRD
jgi:histone demethylase JARID1